MQLSALVKYRRQQLGLSQRGLAQVAGVGKTLVFDIERGKTSVQLDCLVKILTALDVELSFKTPTLNIAYKKTA